MKLLIIDIDKRIPIMGNLNGDRVYSYVALENQRDIVHILGHILTYYTDMIATIGDVIVIIIRRRNRLASKELFNESPGCIVALSILICSLRIRPLIAS